MGNPHLGSIRLRLQLFRGNFSPEEPAGQLDGFDDPDIAGASAEVSSKRMLDFFRTGIRIQVEQRLGGQDHPGGAEPALDRSGEHEGFLDQVGVVGCAQPLDRDDVGPFEVHDLDEARSNRFSVYDDGARAALSLAVARLLRAREAIHFPEEVEKYQVRIGYHLPRSAIHLQVDFLHNILGLMGYCVDFERPRPGRIGLSPVAPGIRSTLHSDAVRFAQNNAPRPALLCHSRHIDS